MRIAGLDRAHHSAGNSEQVLYAIADRLAVEHDVELRRENEDADSGQHTVNDGWRNGAEPLPELQHPSGELDNAGEQDDGAEHFDTVLLNLHKSSHN